MTDRSADEQKALSRERFAPRADGYRESALHAAGRDLELLIEWLDPKPITYQKLDSESVDFKGYLQDSR